MSDRAWTVWGVAEISCWLGHFADAMPTGHDAEDCLDAHAECGITHVAWALGRSVVRYHSALQDVTSAGRDTPLDGLEGQARAIEAMFGERCQLRAALTHAAKHGMTIYGRLCMNRHYRPGTIARSNFADSHPEWCEVQKDAQPDPTRLCYAVPQYRSERVAILREAAEIGCHGLCLDFCRQPPIVRYHSAFVDPYREGTGKDPRQLSLADGDAFLGWCQHRADAVTQFLRELKDALDSLRAETGRSIPVQVRIPNDGFEANLIAGLDVVTWCGEGLIDELALSELRWLAECSDWDDRPYIHMGREAGIPVYASSSCLPKQPGGWGGRVNPAGVNPLVLARRALRSLEEGAQGISLYQSDTGVRWPGMPQVLSALGDETTLTKVVGDARLTAQYPITPNNAEFGIDNHSRSPSELRFRADVGADECGV